MGLSGRLAVVFGGLGLIVITAIAGVSYLLASSESRQSIDNELLQRLAPFEAIIGTGELPPGAFPFERPRADELNGDDPQRALSDLSELSAIGDTTSIAALTPGGTTIGGPANSSTSAAFASIQSGQPHLETVTVSGVPYRVLTLGTEAEPVNRSDDNVVAIQLYRNITNEERALDDLALRLGVLSAVGLAVVLVLSWLIGRWMARPIIRLAETAESLAQLDDYPGRVEVSRSDEIGRLADSYNRLMSALEVGREQQRRLVADASHELRTPLTSLRMRVEYLATQTVDDAQHAEILAAAVVDAEHLSLLVSDLVDLAADVRSAEEELVRCRLGELVADVVGNAQASSGRAILVDCDDTVTDVYPTMVRRALRNLIDNAIKYSPDGDIVVTSKNGMIEVRDHGPGIAIEDRDHVFDRFFRSPRARSRPGNGIGLAIVKQVADAHNGSTWATSATSGAVVGFSVAVS